MLLEPSKLFFPLNSWGERGVRCPVWEAAGCGGEASHAQLHGGRALCPCTPVSASGSVTTGAFEEHHGPLCEPPFLRDVFQLA